ncbi:MAG: glycosyltransferase family 2 protein [Candidatus Daviesbacteria bacterium]|nr:glycosyltransferase family 2 protein [Candidatus Daviesbacteria bacterium]
MNRISIIIVTFNSAKTIKACVDSINKFVTDSEIIIVDNNSQDDTCKIIQGFGDKVKLIQPGGNLGFAKANNLGIKSALGEYIIFLNPDTRIMEKDSLEKLVATLEDNTEYGIIGPKLVYPDGSLQSRTRNLPTVLRAFQEYILNKKGSYDFYTPVCKTLCEVESVIGACIVIKKKLFQKVGGFDEKYFMYFEDLELCRNVRLSGLKVGYLPEVKIEHAEGKSGVNQKTSNMLHNSAKLYHGFVKYYLIEAMLIAIRVRNKIKNILT